MWPELVGQDVNEKTISIINKSNPNVTVVKFPEGNARIDDFCCNRVYLYFTPDNKVFKVPKVG